MSFHFDLDEFLRTLELNERLSLDEFVFYYNLLPDRDFGFNDLSREWEGARKSFHELRAIIIKNRIAFDDNTSEVRSLLLCAMRTLNMFENLADRYPINDCYLLDLFDVSGIVNEIRQKLNALTEYEYVPINQEKVKLELKHYITIGDKIYNDRINDKTSLTSKMNTLALDLDGFIQSYPGRNVPDDSIENLEKSFVAISVPILAGKTQSCFTVRTKRPIYFALEQYQHNPLYADTTEIQPIYRNFESLNKAIEEFAKSDIEDWFNESDGTVSMDEVSRQNLLTYFYSSESRVLGFLSAIARDGNIYFEDDESNWMHFYSKKSSENFKKVSIADFRCEKDVLDKYFIFLDEFPCKTWAIFLRNICRSVGFNCFLANSTTNMTNYTDCTSSASYTRYNEEQVYCVVITDLEPTNMRCLLNIFTGTGITTCIDDKMVDNVQKNMMEKFLHYIVETLIPRTRPGIAVKIKEYLHDFSAVIGKLSVEDCMNHIILKLSQYLMKWKPSMFYSNGGSSGNLGLFTEQAYFPDKNLAKINNSKTYFIQHLYYLINPVDTSSNVFLTYRSNNKGKPNKLFIEAYNMHTKTPWCRRSYFKSDEEILLLACFYISFQKSVHSVVESNKEWLDDPCSLMITSDPLDWPTQWNKLELIAMSAIIDSSHYSTFLDSRNIDQDRLSLTGISGANFVINLIRNLVNDQSVKDDKFPIRATSISLQPFPEHGEGLLDEITVPFLNSANRKWSEFFETNFKIGSKNMPQFGNYTRIGEEFNNIKGTFDVLRKRKRESQCDDDSLWTRFKNIFKTKTKTVSGRAVVECKGDLLSASEYLQLLKNCQKGKSKSRDKPTILHLTFCKKLDFYDDKQELDMNNLINFGIKNKYNFYRFQRTDPEGTLFDVIRLRFDSKMHSKPKMICLIFEMDSINQIDA